MIDRQDLGEGVIALAFDRPKSKHNYKDKAAVAEFDQFIKEALADEGVKGIVITSAKDTFIVGGDLKELQAIKSAEEAEAMVANVQATLRAMELSEKPVVAAINGLALGGGLELALACTYRIGSDDKGLSLGLPEATLGLMPGAGGTQRLPRLIGLEKAIPVMLDGKHIAGKTALELGILDEIVKAEDLISTAKDRILSGRAPTQQPWDQENFQIMGPQLESDEGKNIIKKAWAKVNQKKPGLEPAPEAILTAIQEGIVLNIDDGLSLERKQFGEIVASKVSSNKIRTLFYGMKAASAMKDRPADIEPYKISSVAVIGVGLMGSGIAYCAAKAGFEVFLVDISTEAAEKGHQSIARTIERTVDRGFLRRDVADNMLACLKPTADYKDITNVDMVFEAVAEITDVKRAVIEQASSVIRTGVPIASNTSTIPITKLSAFTEHPNSFIGLHFFAPADRMKLVEVIRSNDTDNQTLARSLDFLTAIRKTPIVVNDGLGFFTSRVVGAYTGEALTLLAEGIDPFLIDDVALKGGMPIGPLAMADMTSLTLLKDIFASVVSDTSRMGLKGMRAVEALDRLVNKFDRSGKNSSQGIFNYGEKSQEKWDGLAECFPPIDTQPNRETIEQRLFHAQALEAARAIEEGIVQTAIDADVGSVLGWAFPSSYGGVIGYIHTIGVKQFISECEDIRVQFGDRFTPPVMLKKMAENGDEFYND